ncbi:MAG: hypothetical protein ABRQ25_16200 [Clostridiaceae bacterium]
MCENLYKEFDDILDLRKLMLQYAEDNYEMLNNAVRDNTAEVKYGRDALYLGYFCPSLVLDKIAGGFKKGRLLKSIPKTNKRYVVYELDINGKLLRIQSINSYGTIFENYIIRKDNVEFGVNLFKGKKNSIVSSTRAIYDDGKISRFDIIGSSHMWSEVYSYDSNYPNKIKCKEYYYVPELTGSDKSIPIGQPGSPMRLFEMEIEIDNNNNIIKIEHGEFINGNTELTCVYMK